MKKILTGFSALLLTFPAFAATRIDLSVKPANFLNTQGYISSGVTMKEISRSVDFNKTLHIRMQETYQGYPVLGADAIVHVPNKGASTQPALMAMTKNTTMNGIVYQGLNQDLANTLANVTDAKQIEKAQSYAISLHQKKIGKNVEVSNQESRVIVYVDKNNKAHWAYRVSFFVPSLSRAAPTKPTFILDAMNFEVYEQWNDLKTLEKVSGGGLGGNHKTGQKIFDGLAGHAPKLDMQRNPETGICQFRNDDVVIRDYRKKGKPVQFVCKATDAEHNDVYWNGNHDQVETTWSPSNDVLFGAKVTHDMFQDWYHMPMLEEGGKPLFLPITVHDPIENAYWGNNQVVFGDSVGSSMFNPFTQLDTVAHEIGHGFTEKHSDLVYYAQSGGLNEAFSDMAGITAEFYAYGKTEFLVGLGDVKEEGKALRYMDQPSKDCEGGKPGYGCSIDNMKQYNSGIDVHYSSGIFNRVYYLLANTPNWDPRKAFEVMIKANMHYWTSNTTFAEAACGVLKATQDYHYELDAPIKAFETVGIKTDACLTEKPGK